MTLASRIRGGFSGFMAGRPRHEPQQRTIPFARMLSFGWGGGADWRNKKRVLPKGTPSNLRYFSRSVYARRAINAIKNPIKMLEWEIAPIDGVELNSALQKQIDVATACFKQPNHSDSFHTFVEQLLEDYLAVSAGCAEIKTGGDKMRPLWLFPVDGTSIQIFPGWDGQPDEARYLQTYGYSNSGLQQGIQLRDDELLYMRPNPSAATPYGFGPTEIAFNTINRILGAGSFAGDVASNANPENILWLAKADEDAIQQYRLYWIDEIEGQGVTPIIGGQDKPEVLKLHTGGDDTLYIGWQTFLKREIATAFDLSAQNLNVDHDVNRNQGENNEDRDWDQAIKPTAFLVASHLTRDCLHKALGFYQLQFKWKGLERSDENADAERFKLYYTNNAVTPNEWRTKIGMPPMEGPWGDKTFADFQIAMAAARGAKTVDDPELTADGDPLPSEKHDVPKAHDRPRRRR